MKQPTTREPKGRSPDERPKDQPRSKEPPLSLYPLDLEKALKGAIDAGAYPKRRKKPVKQSG